MITAAKGRAYLAIIVVASVLLFAMFFAQEPHDQKFITTWASNSGFVVRKSERQSRFNRGPYWIVLKSDRLYRVELDNGRIYWFKFSLSDTDIKED